MKEPENSQTQSYCTVKQLAEDKALCFTEAMWRYYVANSHKNGLASAIRRIGKKLVFRRDLVIDWIEKQSQRKATV